MSRRYIFSSESVTEGHPDKVCDTISDYILDACLEQDPLSRVACETLAKGNLVVLAGEITSNAKFDYVERVREAVRNIGYVNGDCIFHADTCRVVCEITEQSPDVKQKEIRETLIELLIKKVMPPEWLDAKTTFLINPTGRFVIGGPEGDAGITGRKIIVDSYGGMGRHGGGAFSGKDPSKVDRSAAYMGRWVAKNVVAAGLADRCEVQFAYAIGHPDPVSVSIDTFCTGKVDEEKLERAVCEVFNFKPAEIIRQLNLLRPIYRKTTNYGHFGRIDDLDALTWERANKADELKKAMK